ncbi:MAG: hypothetical protein JSR52_00760 [Planctomycetes bacterium]|nr:hypothetical protein [Planctomycetota bacterium]
MSRPVALADLAEDLLWPRLLLIPTIALRPASITIGFFALLLAGLIGDLTRLWQSPEVLPMSSLVWAQLSRAVPGFFSLLWQGIVSADPDRIRDAFSMLGRIPQILWYAHKWGTLLAIPMATVLLIAGGAISRIAACDFAHGVRLPWVDALGFAVKRWHSLILCFLGPVLLALLAYSFIAAGGWALFSMNWTQWAGAILFPVALVAAAFAVALLTLTTLGAPLMVPAVACENADAIEAMQRAFAYVPARPIRSFWYAVVALATGCVATAVAVALCVAVAKFAESASVAWIKQPPPGLGGNNETGFTSFVLRLWIGVPLLIGAAYGMSLIFSGCTVFYLLLRRVIDGQAISDIWMPGMARGTLAPLEEPSGSPVDASVSVPKDESED